MPLHSVAYVVREWHANDWKHFARKHQYSWQCEQPNSSELLCDVRLLLRNLQLEETWILVGFIFVFGMRERVCLAAIKFGDRQNSNGPKHCRIYVMRLEERQRHKESCKWIEGIRRSCCAVCSDLERSKNHRRHQHSEMTAFCTTNESCGSPNMLIRISAS